MGIIHDSVGKNTAFKNKIWWDFFCYFPKCNDLDKIKFMTYKYMNIPRIQKIFITLSSYLLLLLNSKCVLSLWQANHLKRRNYYLIDNNYEPFENPKNAIVFVIIILNFKNLWIKNRLGNGKAILFYLLCLHWVKFGTFFTF